MFCVRGVSLKHQGIMRVTLVESNKRNIEYHRYDRSDTFVCNLNKWMNTWISYCVKDSLLTLLAIMFIKVESASQTNNKQFCDFL